MKIAILQLANDEVCVCGRCTRPGGDGGARSYKPMIQAMRETWAAEEVEGVKVYYIYGHREGVDFPEDSEMIESHERYWPYGSAGEGFEPVDVQEKRAPFAIGDCIYSDTPEGRENIYYKTIDGFQWLVENEEFDYLMRLLMPPKDPDPYIDYGSEQKVAKGGKVYGNSTRKSQYKAG